MDSWTRNEIVSTEFREITIKSFDDLIGGVRYVCHVESGGTHQLLPFGGGNCVWFCSTWGGIAKTASNGTFSRGNLGKSAFAQQARLLSGTWFLKCPTELFSFDPFSKTRRDFLYQFLSVKGTCGETPDIAIRAVKERHPIDQNKRLEADLTRRQRELDARESALRTKEVFRQVDDMRGIAAQMMVRGKDFEARKILQEADGLKQAIQGYLDRREEVPPQLLYASQRGELGGLISDGNSPVAEPKRVFSIDPPRKRLIVLDGEV